MSRFSSEEWRSRSVEPGWPFGGRPKPQRLWSLWKSGSLMDAEINEHPLGFELRVYMQGAYLCSFVRPTRELTEEEADEIKRERMAAGWLDKLVMTE